MTINPTSFSAFSTFGTGGTDSASAASASTGASSAAATTGTGGTDTLNSTGLSGMGLSSDDFMKLFLAQLQNQDPTKPVDDSAMLGELSQMTEISTLQSVQKSLEGSQLAQSSALIGKNVTGVDVNGTAVNGVVTSVTQSTDAGLVLQVGAQYIKPDAVTVVTAPATSSATS